MVSVFIFLLKVVDILGKSIYNRDIEIPGGYNL